MKTIVIQRAITTIVLVATTSLFAWAGETVKYQVNKEKSQVSWVGKKVTGEHKGAVKISEGILSMADGKISSGKFTIDMNSISCTDLEDAGYNQKLVGHLKSDDFFGVKKHPTAMLNILRAIPQGKDRYKVVAEITIKGITKEIKFPAETSMSNGVMNIEADLVIDRSDFNVKYGSGSFFDDLGDKTIYDDFYLNIKLVTKG